MPYYIWKRRGKVAAYDYSSTPRPSPAIEITDDEAKALGIYVPRPQNVPAPEPIEPPKTDTDLMAEAYREGVNES